MEIKSLEKTDFDTLFRAFGRAFADYEVQLNAEQLRAMLTRRGFDPALSFAAFDGAQIAAFTLNGIGNFNGVPTAYDTGTGTLKEYRGTGLGTEIFRHSMPHLRRAGVGQYLLEVLQHNTRAVSVYRNLGFETVREFNYFCRANTEIADRGDTPRLPHSVRRTDPEKFASISAVPQKGNRRPAAAGDAPAEQERLHQNHKYRRFVRLDNRIPASEKHRAAGKAVRNDPEDMTRRQRIAGSRIRPAAPFLRAAPR